MSNIFLSNRSFFRKTFLILIAIILTTLVASCTYSTGSYPASSLGVVVDANFMVMDVQKGSSAENAGIQIGDILLTLDGNTYPTPDSWIDPLGAMAEGQTYQVTLQRGNATLTLEVTAARQDPDLYSPGITPTPIQSGLYYL
ncbi:MAG: PDZ domain-containing protein [Anaerolineales bacterium]|nr:PDZ domain-containing protein [Anaerolineales bacterium]